MSGTIYVWHGPKKIEVRSIYIINQNTIAEGTRFLDPGDMLFGQFAKQVPDGIYDENGNRKRVNLSPGDIASTRG